MAVTQKSNIFDQVSIAAQIIDGSIIIDSVEEFYDILKLFPNDPALLRAYADLLVTKGLSDAAAESYRKAAGLFIDAGMTLQAIVAKSLQWNIHSPGATSEIKLFFSTLKKAGSQQSPAETFFRGLSYPAMIGILYPLVKVHLPAGRVVKKAGDSEEDLYFIVSGTLRATAYQPVKKGGETMYTKSTANLTENTFFGEIYPFEDKQRSQSYIEAITQTELIKLSKINLMKICVNFPEVEHALMQLYEMRISSGVNRHFSRQRMGNRQPLPIRVYLQVHAGETASPPLDLKGYSRDISIGGICVVLDSEFQRFDSFSRYVRDARVKIAFPSEDLTLNVDGTVVWSREIDLDKGKAMALGIQFQDMSPKSRGILLGFANNVGGSEWD